MTESTSANDAPRIEGNQLTMRADREIPDGPCWICGNEENAILIAKRFSYTPTGAGLTTVTKVLLTRKAEISFPLCPSCDAKARESSIVGMLGCLGFLATPVVFGLIGNNLLDRPWSGALVGVFAGFVLLGLLGSKYEDLEIRSKEITHDGLITLRIPRPEIAARALGVAIPPAVTAAPTPATAS
jgi:hypothetical protein